MSASSGLTGGYLRRILGFLSWVRGLLCLTCQIDLN
jgi:hypothetical protein